jgi:FAD/FMN-containing dehydrogenase
MNNKDLGPVVGKLSKSFSGRLLLSGDPGYDEVRKVHNGLVDKRPALIARCRGVADIRDAIRTARALDLEIAVRGGGHNVAGRAVVDGGLMLDLSLMKGIQVDVRRRVVRAEGGVTWAEFNRETQVYDLATTGGVVSSTGVAGFTLGGGLGWLMGRYGLAVDNLLGVEMVDAEGRILRANAEENENLYWAVRGGGGNFGVAARFDFRAHPLGMVTAGLVAHPFSVAREVLQYYRELTSSPPEDLTVFAGLLHAPDGSGAKLAGIVLCHCGSPAEGEAAVRPVKRFGSPVLDTIGPMDYCTLNSFMDPAFPKGAFNYWKSSFLSQLDDTAIDTLIECFARCPSTMSQISLEHLHGAAVRPHVSDTAFPHRSPGYNLLVLSQWSEAARHASGIAWARETYGAMQPFMATTRYVNYLDQDEPIDTVAAAYGVNYSRLQQVKAKYDPENVFHLNQNIRPPARA